MKAACRELSGPWIGWYGYGQSDRRHEMVRFTAWLETRHGVLTGTTLEPNTFVATEIDELSGELSGIVTGTQVLFDKNYLTVPGGHKGRVSYSGMLNTDDTEITGEWKASFDGVPRTGPFALCRVLGSSTIEDEIESILRRL